ncbi:tripartite tricarboxylate transporter substrate binding protein [Ideonella livida]|uniref:Tripartite tricarboxylate transporter substrate binding protein n=1 Tax=Ideonella livida TaxID=2707176 RepID=A0A7C9PKH3_9BURK|nr:tripartite tricarboxylate transporter substrate binding protein [Ideonella livida]NDY93330.1 tripartite tricarboxylate transporter substrate binding protein [Ideonella livida]
MAAVSLAVAALAPVTAAQAQTAGAAPWPAGPVRLLVGFAAGGPSDLVARAFADHAARPLGQPLVVENRPGANAVLATEAVAQARPDGQTLLAAASNHAMIPALYAARIRFDAARAFSPVCTLAQSATVLVVGPALPVRSLAELLQLARSRPQGLTYGSPGLGSSPHLAAERFARLAGVPLVHVPYKGAAPVVTDLMGGQLELSLATLGSVLPHLKSGRLTALAVASARRSTLLPQVPTFEEAGLKGFTVDTWYGVLAPAGTPAPALQALTREAMAFGQSPAVRERLASAGLEPSTVCGEAFAAQITQEIALNQRLAQALDLKAE